jgi:hypothetical protein
MFSILSYLTSTQPLTNIDIAFTGFRDIHHDLLLRLSFPDSHQGLIQPGRKIRQDFLSTFEADSDAFISHHPLTHQDKDNVMVYKTCMNRSLATRRYLEIRRAKSISLIDDLRLWVRLAFCLLVQIKHGFQFYTRRVEVMLRV